MTIDQERFEGNGGVYSLKCYFPEKRTLGLIASIPAVENVVTPEGEIKDTAVNSTPSNLWSIEI